MSSPSMRAWVALGAVVAGLATASDASAGNCGNGTCEPGEDAGSCAEDCLCQNTASVDYALCCCCGGAPTGECTPKAICNYPEIGGCCCAQFDPLDPFTCLFCVDKEEIPGWCSGGIGAFEGAGTCGPAAATVCGDTEITDDYVDGVNARTRCGVLEIPLGSIEVGNVISTPVSLVHNEGRPPPAELLRGFEQTAMAKTGPYGAGFWMSTDRIFTDEGIYWSNVDAAGQAVTQAVRMGTRGDRNGNGYVGYTLHTPFGSRTYDYPVVLTMDGKSVAAYRSEPFDGQFLTIEEQPNNLLHNRIYTLFRYPNGPFEIYDWSLSAAWGPWDDPPADVKKASLLSTIRAYFGPPKKAYAGDWFEPKDIRITRARFTFPSANGGNGLSNTTWSVHGSIDFTNGWSIDLGEPAVQPDGGIQVEIKSSPGDLKSTLTATANAGFHLETLTRPGRQGADLYTFGWDADGRLESRDVQTRDAAMKTTFQSTSKLARDDGAPTVASITRSDKILGVARRDETTYFETCDADGNAFEGTTVTLPRNVRTSFEYGDASQGHRLTAITSPLGVRTQYLYNDASTEPRGELTDVAAVPAETEPIQMKTGAGTHIELDWVTQNALDPSLFPPDTFVGPKASKGIPLPKEVRRLPDGLPLQRLSQYDTKVLLPTRVVDERGFAHVLSYYPDTAQLESYTRRGITTRYKRAFELPTVLTDAYATGYFFLSMETIVQGAGAPVTVGKRYWDHAGRLYSDVSFGQQFVPDQIGTGLVKPVRIEKVFVRGSFMKPSKLQTWVDKKLVAETVVEWDPRLRGPASASSSAGGSAVSGAAPVQGKGKVDGLGTAVGSWEITAMGRKLSVTTELDPLGNILSSSVDGLGAKIAYAAGPMGAVTIKTSLVGPNGEVPLGETTESPGTTERVCK